MRIFEFHQPVFKKVTSAGLSSLQQKGYQILVKIWIFDDPFHKKIIELVICVLGMIQRSSWVNFLMKWGCWGHWGYWGSWGHKGHWGCRGCRGDNSWKIITEDFSVISRFLNSALLWCFEEKKIGYVASGNIMLNFSILSVRGCWGQPILKTGWWNTNIQTSWNH